MKKAITNVVFLDTLFILFLLLSGASSGGVSEILYYAAFVFPVTVGVVMLHGEGARISPRLGMRPRGLLVTAVIMPIFLALVFAVSCVTALILSFLGGQNTTDVSGNIFAVIFKHAFITAILEEALFRYIPIAFISRYSNRAAVIFSSLFFAFAHCNLYQIFYAFFAGVVFSVLNIMLESSLPSLILHTVNNILSVIWLRYGTAAGFARTYVILLFGFALLSAVAVLVCGKRYRGMLRTAFGTERQPFECGYAPWVFIAMTAALAVFVIF